MLGSIRTGFKRVFTLLNRYRGEILYYGSVLLVLSALAWGAEQYRIHRTGTQAQTPSVAAVEIVPMEVPEAPPFELPAGMAIVQDYSEIPKWNEADQSWQAHPATDYVSADGFIRALGNGSVQFVGKNGVLGGFIEVRSGEVVLKYCGIQADENLICGKEICKGDLLGVARNAMPGEKHLGEHMHLEAYRNEEIFNVRDLLAGND